MISVGVDIGTFSIKIAEVEPTSKSYVLRRIQEIPYSPDLTKDRKIEIIDILRTQFSLYPPDQTQFIFGVPQRFVSARMVTFPFRERFKIQRAVLSQLEDELPFGADDAVFEVKITRFNGKAADVLAMAVPTEHVSDIIDLAKDCGVEPKILSTENAGLSNLFERWSLPPPEAPAALVEIPGARPAELVLQIGHASTELLAYADGLLLGVRHIDWGAINIASSLAAKYGMNPIQAMSELQAKGFILLDTAQGTKEQAAFSTVIEDAVKQMTSHLRLVMLELQSEFNLQWTRGSLLGGCTQLKNLGAFLTQQIQIPFNRYRQFENHPAGGFEGDAHLELVGGVAVGLAIEGLRRPRNPAVNFMKGEFAPQQNAFRQLWDRWGYASRVAGTAFVMLLGYSCARETLTTTMLEQSNEVLGKQAQTIAGMKKGASPDRIRKFISAQEGIDKARKQSEKVVQINSALDVLDLLSSSLPGTEALKLEIKRLSIDGEQAEVHGYAANAGERDQVLTAIKRASLNNRADSATVKIPVPAGKIGFAYRFKVRRQAGG